MLKGQTVLVVDDDPRLTDGIEIVLRGHGMEVRTAHNGMHGYASYFRNPTDWIVTDIEMPEIDGLEMVQCMRAIEASVKVVYMTGAADKYWAALAQEARAFGAQFLRKPFGFNLLLDILATKPKPQVESAVANLTLRTATKNFSSDR